MLKKGECVAKQANPGRGKNISTLKTLRPSSGGHVVGLRQKITPTSNRLRLCLYLIIDMEIDNDTSSGLIYMCIVCMYRW